MFTALSPNLLDPPVLSSVQWVCMMTDGSLTTVMKNKPGKEAARVQRSGETLKNQMNLQTGL